MAAPFVLVVLIVGRGHERADESTVRSASSTLPVGSSVVVRNLDGAPTEAEALRFEEREAARAVAIVSWEGGERRVRLRLHRREDARFLERNILFEASDAPAEQGRTVGFALASMIPEASPALALVAPAEPARGSTPSATNPGAAAPSPGAPSEPAPTSAAASTPPADAPEAKDRAGVRATDAAARVYLDGAVFAAAGLGGYAGGFGGRAGLAWIAGERVALRVDGTLRTGEVPPASVSSLVASVGPGVSLEAVVARPVQPIFVAARVNALALFHSHSHLSDEPEPVRESRWLPGASALVEAGLRLSSGARIFLAGGAEVAFGKTDVFLRSTKVATVPPGRALAEAGIRVRF